MALITCPECGKQVSDKARSCASCGYPITETPDASSSDCGLPKPPAEFARDECAHSEMGGKSNQVTDGLTADCPYRIDKNGSTGNLRFVANRKDNVYLECDECGKVFKLKKSLFESVDENGCTTLIEIRCPHCESVDAISNQRMADKASSSSVPQKKATRTQGANGCLGLLIFYIVMLLFSGLSQCSAPSSTEYSGYSVSEEESLEEEVSHYYYDEFGHLEDDRDPDRY